MQRKAHSRRYLNIIDQKLKRLKVSSVVLSGLIFIYAATKLVTNLTIFHPVQGLATSDIEVRIVEKIVVKEIPAENISTWISDAVNQYLPNHKSESLMIMHCLAHRESGHGASNAQGDGGLAGGGFQFHEATWQRMRKQMLKAGLITEIGSRFDLKQATYTTAWAIANGRALEWGPILRDSKESDFASCQTPSWYK